MTKPHIRYVGGDQRGPSGRRVPRQWIVTAPNGDLLPIQHSGEHCTACGGDVQALGRWLSKLATRGLFGLAA